MIPVNQFVTSVACALLLCKFEYPSDPLNSPTEGSLRSTRVAGLRKTEDRFNNVLGSIYDFSKGDSNPIVSTKPGKLEGYVMKSIKGRSIYAFEGIPFAETTGGVNRFQPAIPKAPWSGIRPAKGVGEFCMQTHMFRLMRVFGSEDCLFLNIYVPSEPILKGRTGLPVLVFFHGGSWFFGSGAEYGPSYLLEHDVILVTVNYRLGILGFLSTGDENMPGNLGLKDQRTALQWVQENIAGFGGDPGLVTITGQSGGAASVHLHMLSPSSRGLFSGAFSMSGSAFNPWSITTPRMRDIRNRKLARATNCPLTSNRDFVNCLRRIDARRLTRRFLRLFDVVVLLPPVPLGAVIEEDHPGAFLTEHPDVTYAENRTARVPWICSSTENESQIIYSIIERLARRNSRIASPVLKRLWKTLAPNLLDYVWIADNPAEITNKVTKFYLGSDNPDLVMNQAVIAEAASNRLFDYGIHKSLQLHSQIAPTYSYKYGYQGRNSVGGAFGFNPLEIGVSHIDDLGSFFNMSDVFAGYRTTDPEYAVVKLMTSMLYNFAATRDPLYTDEDGKTHRIWEPVTNPRRLRFLEIKNEVRMISETPIQKQKLKFWENLGLSDMKPFIPID